MKYVMILAIMCTAAQITAFQKIKNAWNARFHPVSIQALHAAAMRGNIPEIERIVAAGISVDARDEDDWSALHWAAQNNHVAAIDTLVALGANINALNNDDDTPLGRAMHKDAYDAFEKLLTLHADFTWRNKDTGDTILDYAATSNNPHRARYVQLLLEKGAKPGNPMVFLWRADEQPDVKKVVEGYYNNFKEQIAALKKVREQVKQERIQEFAVDSKELECLHQSIITKQQQEPFKSRGSTTI